MPEKCVIGVADHFIAHLLERFAEQCSMQTVRANSGQALLEIAQQVRPDFIIVDNELPGTIQGEEVIWALRSNAGTSQIPLVLCSWLPATEAQALFGEMTAYLAKPKLDYQGFLAAASLVAHTKPPAGEAVSSRATKSMKSNQEKSEKKYESNWESLNSRPCPEWFPNAKFGIFISWGPYSVPAYKADSGYAEWIGHPGKGWMNDPFIKANFGENVIYDDFAKQFKAELYDPNQWAELIQKSGAKYVFLTAKYHDGFCLWPSSYATNGKTNTWHAGSMGPKRDVVGPFCDAMRAKGLFTGLYFSLHEWFHPLCGDYTDDFFYCKEPERFAREHMHPQFKEMVNLYKPDLIFADGDTISPEKWETADMIAWLYNESPVKDTVVINDRFGFWTDEKYGRGKIGDYCTTEYGFGLMLDGNTKPWEESRGIGSSYGYNRKENINGYKSSAELIAILIDIVSKGGNFALDIGPTGDGRIPVIMQERLLDIGAWLAVNGEAIYGTKKWIRPNEEGDTSFQVSNEDFKFDGTEIKTAKTNKICFTQKDSQIFVICVGWPGETIEFEPDGVKEIKRISLLGLNEDILWRFENGLLRIQVPQLTIDKLPCSHAWSFKIETN